MSTKDRLAQRSSAELGEHWVLHTSLGELCLDFVKDRHLYLRALPLGKNELIAKAIGMNKGWRQVLDLSAGLAQDAVVLARLGCQVLAVERSSLIFPLLQQAHAWAEAAKPPPEWISRLQVVQSEALAYLQQLPKQERPEVIYFDPMYPEKKKTQALPRKEMQIFRSVLGHDEDASAVLQMALTKAKARVVVKRPLGAEPLLPESVARVDHEYSGKSVRFDVYICHQEGKQNP